MSQWYHPISAYALERYMKLMVMIIMMVLCGTINHLIDGPSVKLMGVIGGKFPFFCQYKVEHF